MQLLYIIIGFTLGYMFFAFVALPRNRSRAYIQIINNTQAVLRKIIAIQLLYRLCIGDYEEFLKDQKLYKKQYGKSLKEAGVLKHEILDHLANIGFYIYPFFKHINSPYKDMRNHIKQVFNEISKQHKIACDPCIYTKEQIKKLDNLYADLGEYTNIIYSEKSFLTIRSRGFWKILNSIGRKFLPDYY
jgi:hypothetical protein